MKRERINNCNIAGFSYHDGPLAFKELEIGTSLNLVAEPENRYDEFAIAVYYKDLKIGYLPRNENKLLSLLLQHNMVKTQCVVQKRAEQEHPENQIWISIYLLTPIKS